MADRVGRSLRGREILELLLPPFHDIVAVQEDILWENYLRRGYRLRLHDLTRGDLILSTGLRTLSLPILALALALSGCEAPANTSQETAPASEAAAAPAPETTAEAPAVSASDQFVHDVMVPKPLDLSDIAIPADLQSKIPDGGKGAITVLEKFIQVANSIPEFQKGSHLNTAADYPLLERLRPYVTPDLFEDAKKQYLQPGGTAIFHNYVNDGSGFNLLQLGRVHPDDNGPVWQWGNEKATIEYASGNGRQGAVIKLPVRFAFNTSDKGVVSVYANRTYQIAYNEDGSWLIGSIEWSAADVRSSRDSTMLLEAESPIDKPA